MTTKLQDISRPATAIADSVWADTARVIEHLLARANGGTPPTKIVVRIDVADRSPAALFARANGCDQLLLSRGPDGRLVVAVGVALSWTVLLHDGFRMAITPGDQIVLIGQMDGRRAWWWVEDGRLSCDYGSPLWLRAQEEEAIAAFDVEFARLVAAAY